MQTAEPLRTSDRWTRKGILRMTGAFFLLVVLIIAGDRIGAVVLDGIVTRSEYRMSRIYRGHENADVLFVGNSRAVNSFHAPSIDEATGLQTFNLSSNRMSMALVEALVRDYIDHNAKPRLVVFEVSNIIASEVDTTSVISSFRPFAFHSERLRDLIDDQAGFDARMCRIFRLSCFNSELTLRALVGLKGSDQNEALHGRFDGHLSGELARLTAHVDRSEAAILARLVADLDAGGVPSRLVVTPVPDAMSRLRTSLPAAIHSLSRQVGEPVLDSTRDLRENRLFHDPLHLNLDGAEAYMRVLLRQGFFHDLGGRSE